MNLKYLLAIIVTAFTLFSCDSTSFVRGEHKVRVAVDSFAFYYFNWQFSKASRFVTDSSQVWLRYAASQVHEADVKILRDKEDATIEIEEINVTSGGEGLPADGHNRNGRTPRQKGFLHSSLGRSD